MVGRGRMGWESRDRLAEVCVRPPLFREKAGCFFFLLKAKVKHGTGRRGQTRSSRVFTSIFGGLALLGHGVGLLAELGGRGGARHPLPQLWHPLILLFLLPRSGSGP